MKRYGFVCIGAFAFAIIGLASFGHAEPLIQMNESTPAPGVVTAWEGSGKRVKLTVGPDADAESVAAAIEANIDRVKAKVTAGKVQVRGKTLDELLPLLAEIDLAQVSFRKRFFLNVLYGA